MQIAIKTVKNGTVICRVVEASSVGKAIVAALRRGEQPLSARVAAHV